MSAAAWGVRETPVRPGDPEQVGLTDVGASCTVSTAWVDRGYQTLVMGGPLAGERASYATRLQAITGHRLMVARVVEAGRPRGVAHEGGRASGWTWVDDAMTPHWEHDCLAGGRGRRLVIGRAVASTTGCPDCGERPGEERPS